MFFFGPQEVDTEGNDGVTSTEISLWPLSIHSSKTPAGVSGSERRRRRKKKKKLREKQKHLWSSLTDKTVTEARRCVSAGDRPSEKASKWKPSAGGDLASPPLSLPLRSCQKLSARLLWASGSLCRSFPGAFLTVLSSYSKGCLLPRCLNCPASSSSAAGTFHLPC